MKFHLVKNFRKGASWKEKLFGDFLLISGNIKVAFRKNLLNRREYSKIAGKLEPGDLVFAGSKREISRFFLRGDLTHALIYIGKKKFIHSTLRHGVGGIYLRELFDKYDFLEAYRYSEISPKKRKSLMIFLLKSYGKAYDFRFLKNNKNEFYCTKLVELAYASADIKIKNKKENSLIPYGSTTHPEDLILHDFELVFSSQSLQEQKTKRWDSSKMWNLLTNSLFKIN